MRKLKNILQRVVKHWLFRVCLCVLLMTAFLELLLFDYFGVDLFSFLKIKHEFFIIPILIPVLGVPLKDAYDEEKKRIRKVKRAVRRGEVGAEAPREDEDPLKRLSLFLRNAIQSGRKNRVSSSVVLLSFIVFASAASAHNHMYGRLFYAAQQFVERVTYSDDDKGASRDTISTAQQEEASGESDTRQGNEDEGNIPDEQPFLLEPDREYELSEDERSQLYFLNDPYAIMDWSSPESVAQELGRFLQELRAQQRPNSFDQDAPEDVKSEIAKASATEALMDNSDDLDSVIIARIDAWNNGYKKYRIASLLANNMQQYAKEYLAIHGSYETIKYYYAYAIFWSWDSLTFASVTPYMEKNALDYIGMRYHDIADMAASGSEDLWRATCLYEAIKLLKNMDFSMDETEMEVNMFSEETI